ncbi:hypothetical protein [Sneathiella chinensis]|uniref:Uncharacterized protein n=1 Tax=Sneathiella chinensis TaxID=349750 RepID=A0ABQ5U1S2_9PROT|nr:hypothetical protein [Sneathiella chinensis]GLQ05804.1 hypothetical protein GCM10007924_10250 [Sneathiella chinensis]
MPSSSPKKIKLNPLQAKTLALLQVLAKDSDSSLPIPDSEDIRITRLPHAHGNHVHVGAFVVSAKDTSGLGNPSVWTALARKGLVRDNWNEDIVITSEGLALSTGLEDKFMSVSDH